MNLKFEFEIPKFDLEGYTRELEDQTKQLRDETVRVYTENVFTRIPVWSGASRATLIPLAQLVEKADLEGRIDPIAFPPVDYPTGDPNHGIQSGILKGGAEIDDKFPKIGFRFFTDLYQFWLYEKDDEWGAMEAGKEAAIDFLTEHGLDYLPKLVKFIKEA